MPQKRANSEEPRDWRRLAGLDEALYCRTDVLPRNVRMPAYISWAGRFLQYRQLPWGSGDALYMYNTTRFRQAFLSRFAGISCIASIIQHQAEPAEHDPNKLLVIERVIRYKLDEPRTSGSLLTDRESFFETEGSLADLEALLSQMRASDVVQNKIGTGRPTSETFGRLAALMEMGEKLTRPPEKPEES